MSVLWILVLALAHQTWAQCKDNTDCLSCAKDKTWIGTDCRWCPLTKTCYSPGSSHNKCFPNEDIIYPSHCPAGKEDYDPATALKMTMLSAVAYSDDAVKYISLAQPQAQYQDVSQVIVDCGGNAKCSGFTAVSHLEGTVVVAFRGSEKDEQVVAQVLQSLTSCTKDVPSGGKVQPYFKAAFDGIWSALKSSVYALVAANPGYKVYVTGHSLGGALASIASSTMVFEGVSSSSRTILYTLGEPRVGDFNFATAHDQLVTSSWRIVHFRDIVKHLPSCHNPLGYCVQASQFPYHHGTEVFYPQRGMTVNSAYKKCFRFPLNEDVHCSNAIKYWSACTLELNKCIDDHREYFGIMVGGWWKTA